MSSDKKSIDEKISEALDVEFDKTEIEPKKPKEISVPKEEMLALREKHANKDYADARASLKDLIDVGRDAVDGILKVASEGDHPRAYEVASQMLKTVSEMNKDLIGLHKQMKELKKEETNINHTTNNSIYVGSTSDLQDLINEARSAKKALNTDIIDAEVIEDDG
tara:strand:+ start:270 stop:764 length:495 start_codon:yes stop_codon:yes gene_type:complete